jgi:hypothetical protein
MIRILRYYFVFIFFVFLWNNEGMAARIYGNAPDYADKSLHFFMYSDLLTEKVDSLFVLNFDGKGNFDQSFSVDIPRPVFTYAGIYKIWFIAEPEGNYELVFPDFVEKTKAEIFNPFFKPILLMAGIRKQDKNDLNRLVNLFDEDFNAYLDENILDLLALGKDSGINEFIDSLEQKYPQTHSEFFTAWKKYRYAKIRRVAYEKNHRFTINYYLQPDSVHYQNPSYMALFNELFDNYFDRFLLRPDGKELTTAINVAKSPTQISKVLGRMFELNNMQLREYVMIKALMDAYYQNNFEKKPILLCLDSLAKFSDSPQHRLAANNVLEKLKHLAVGTLPPDILMEDFEGTQTHLLEIKNRFLYLAFVQTELTSCQEQFGPLVEQAEKHQGDFDLILIVFDEDRGKAMRNLKRYNFNGKVYFPVYPEKVKNEWEIVSFPSYYLTGPDRKLVFSPSPAPTENFEQYFFNIIRKY